MADVSQQCTNTKCHSAVITDNCNTRRVSHRITSRQQHFLFTIACLVLILRTAQCHDDPAPAKHQCGRVNTTFISDEKRLIKCILDESGYDPIVRPVLNGSDVVTVTLEASLISVLDLDEKSHIMTTNGWIYHEWKDFQLQWAPEDFGGVTTIRIPIARLWTPDIVLFNNADESYKYVIDKLAIVSHTGTVVWAPHARLRSYCNLDLARFPFDTQKCALVFGSWTHDMKAIDIIKKRNSTLKHVINSKEWSILKVETNKHQWMYTPGERYAGIISTIQLKRTSSFYQYVFIMPTCIFAFLALLMPFVPPLSRERMMLGVGLVLGCTLVLMMLENHMPTELGTVPVVAAYLAYVLVMVVVNIFFTIIAVNMCMRDPRHGKIPGWVRWIFLTKLNKLVCIPVAPYTAVPADLAQEETLAERELLDMRNGTSEPTASGLVGKSPMEQTMEDIRRYMRVVAARTTIGPQLNHKELVSQEWHQVTRVVDRLLFICFLVLTIVITIAMYSHY